MTEPFDLVRADAESVACASCGQPPGQTCVNRLTGKPLQWVPACDWRVTAAYVRPRPSPWSPGSD